MSKDARPIAVIQAGPGTADFVLQSRIEGLQFQTFDSAESLIVASRNTPFAAAAYFLNSTNEQSGRSPQHLSEALGGIPILEFRVSEVIQVSLSHQGSMQDGVGLECASDLAGQISRALGRAKINEPRRGKLTNTQFEVIYLVAEGSTNAEIAGLRETTIRNIESIISRAFIRLGVPAQAGVRAKVLAARKYVEEFGQSHAISIKNKQRGAHRVSRV